jgi:hypothetical protein
MKSTKSFGCYCVSVSYAFGKPPRGERTGTIVAPIQFNKVRMNGEVL